MFKHGRGGGGRGGGKRPLQQAPPSRPATVPDAPRLPLGGVALGRPGSAPGACAPLGREESFSLSSSADLDFGAIIRLTPDLIEEIKRVESQGGSARIKFAPNFTLPSGNVSDQTGDDMYHRQDHYFIESFCNAFLKVIDVGGKEFGFTWSRDDLCDIYEEHQSGEGGDGLLVECGSAWRKLNVLRTLDESTKKHVKKRSEEAERQHKSRQSIVLDPTNPSMKNQVKMMAAAGVEGNMRRMGWKQKKEPFFKKQKVDSNQVSNACLAKSVSKPGTSSNRTAKVMLSGSHISSPSEQPAPGSAISPFATGISSRVDANVEEISPPLGINKEHIDIGNFEKEMPNKSAHGAKHKAGGQKGRTGDQPEDLHSNRARRASENSKGMSLQALEKADEETIPNPTKKNGSTIKDASGKCLLPVGANIGINSFSSYFGLQIEAPGKHLKLGVEVESSKRRESESGSSLVSVHDIASAIESIFGEKITDGNFEEQAQQTSKIEEDSFEKIDIMQDNSDPFSNADKKVSNDSEGKTSSSESGSDSDSESDSSDSGSDSGSQRRSLTKSRSPVGSASASSRDSESDCSSSSKEGSDVDVDIINEDEKERAEPKVVTADLNLSSPRIRASDGEQEQIDILGDQEQVASVPVYLNDFGRDDDMAVEASEDFPIDNNIKTSDIPEVEVSAGMESNSHGANSRFPQVSPHHKHPEDLQVQFVKSPHGTNERVIKKTIYEKQPILSNSSAREKVETSEKTKTKRASGSDLKEYPESATKSKGARAAEVMPCVKSKDAALSSKSRYTAPEKAKQDQYKSNNLEWGGIKDMDSQEYSLADRSRSGSFENTRKIQQSPEFWSSSALDAEQPGSGTGDTSARRKSTDIFNNNMDIMPFHADTMPRDKMYKDTQDEIPVSEKLSSLPEYNRKSGDHGHLKDNGPPPQIRKSNGNKSPVISGKGPVLRRELSELELGELCEPPAGGEPVGVKRQSEGKNSMKPSESKAASTDRSNLDVSKKSSGSHILLESKKHSPPNLRGEVHGNQEGYRKMPPDDTVDAARVLQRTIPSQGQQPLRVDNTDSVELAHRGGTGTNQGTGLENFAGSLKKSPTSLQPQHDIKHGGQKGYQNAKETKQQKPNTLGDSADRSNNSLSMENEINGRKRRESFIEVDNLFYSKYDKAAPDLRESIKDFSQYNDYVQEYGEKYDCYISLNKNLENIRNDFFKVGEELKLAKGRCPEEYYKVIGQLRKMYHRNGERNKQMKRVFIVLHEELKSLKQRIKDFVEMNIRG